MNSSHGNDQRGGEASVVGRPPDSLVMANSQPSPNTTFSISFLSQAPGSLEGRDQDGMANQPPPPPGCQIVNPFVQTPPLAPLDARLPPQATGSSLPIGQIGSLVQENTIPMIPNTFGQDLRHHRSYPNVMTLPPTFQVHPNLQSQILAFHNDMNQHAHMTQPSGFLQGFIPTDMNIASVVQHTETNNRASHLLQPHVRQRVRRRSRANRALQHHAHHHVTHNRQQHDGTDAEGVGMGLRSRSLSEVPTARVSVLETGGGFNDTTLVTTAPVVNRLDDSKLKGLEENYSSIGENFECNICFQKAIEAVVTCCGHLFCWSCLYRWLHIHSYHKECPVCKGAIDENSITPIYGRECSALLSARGGIPGGSTTDRIPPRPPARRVESARQLRDREDRSREREQRERALERERERDQQDARGLSDLQVLGSGTTILEEATPTTNMRNDINNQARQPIPTIGGEITNHEISGHSNLEELDQSEGPTHDTIGSEEDGGTPSQTTSTGGSNMSSSVQQDLSNGVGDGANNTRSAFLQRRMSERREQLRAALVVSARNGMNSTTIPSFTDRLDEPRQMMTASALLSQEWEDIVNISQMVGHVNPAQSATWMTTMQAGRLNGMEGTTIDNFGGDLINNNSRGLGRVVIHTSSRPSRPQHHMHNILLPTTMDVGMFGEGGRNESNLNRFVTVNPVQSGDWMSAVRSRLSSMEKIVENLESPSHQLLQQTSSGLLDVNHSLPAQSSSLHFGPLILKNVTNSIVANSESGLAPARRLVEEVCTNLETPRTCTLVIVESPNTRRLDEETVMTIVQPQAAPSQQEPNASASGAVVIPQSSYSNRTTTQEDIRLHYREAPLLRPSSSRRRSSRMEDVASTQSASPVEGSGVIAGTDGARHETMRRKSKRRRLN